MDKVGGGLPRAHRRQTVNIFTTVNIKWISHYDVDSDTNR